MSKKAVRSLTSSLKKHKAQIKAEIAKLKREKIKQSYSIYKIKSQMNRSRNKTKIHQLASKLAKARDQHESIVAKIMLLENILESLENTEKLCYRYLVI